MTLTDRYWSDWINPLLIKELRQGLRDKIFVFSLFGMQYLMAFLVFFQVFAAGDESGEAEIFQTVMWITFLGILPIRGFFNYSVANEVKHNTMESLLLSTMGARGIVFGKWISLVFQSFLVVVIILPFMIIQYWVGGTDITDNLEQLSIAFFLNGILSALVIGISCIQFSFMRLGCLFGLTVVVNYGWTLIYDSITVPIFVEELFVLSFLGFFITPFMVFEVAAVYIAISDSKPITRRMGYLILYFGGWCFLQSSDLVIIGVYTLVFTLFCALEAFQPRALKETPSADRVLSRIFNCFFSQTALGGLFFTTVAVPLILFTGFYSQAVCNELTRHTPFPPEVWMTQFAFSLEFTTVILGVVFIPLLIVELFLKRYTSTRIFVIALINLGMVGIGGLVLAALPPTVPTLWLAVLPTAAFDGFISSGNIYNDLYHYVLAVATLGMITNVAGFIALSSVYLIKMK